MKIPGITPVETLRETPGRFPVEVPRGTMEGISESFQKKKPRENQGKISRQHVRDILRKTFEKYSDKFWKKFHENFLRKNTRRTVGKITRGILRAISGNPADKKLEGNFVGFS